MILNKTPRPPKKKTQHDSMRKNSSAGSVAACARAGRWRAKFWRACQLVTAKMNPTRKKAFFLLSVWARNHTETHISSQRRQDSIAQRRWRLCSASARTQPRKDNKETTIKMVFFFSFCEERVPFSQPRKDDGARVATARATSQVLSTRGMGQHNNQKEAIGAKERQQTNNNQNGIFFSSWGEGALLSAKERWWRTMLWRGRLLSASARVWWKDTTIKSMLPWLIFSFSSLNQNQNQNLFHSNMSPSPTFLNDACPAVSPTIFLNDASSSDEEEEQCLFTQPEAEAGDFCYVCPIWHLSASGAELQEFSLSNEIGCQRQRRLLLLWCIAEKIGSFCTNNMWRLLGRGCIRMTIIL